jgi:hypothetical protein
MDSIKEELKEELRFDPTPILKLPEEEPEPDYTEEQKEIIYKRNKALKCKVIVLNLLNYHPIFTNVSELKKNQKEKILNLVYEYFEKDDDEINELFNNVCLNNVFDDESDYTKYPIYKRNI